MTDIVQAAHQKGLPADGILLVIDTARQSLGVYRGGTIEAEYLVSTSRLGIGNDKGSHRTPTGYHEVIERIGEGQPPGTEFKTRKPTGRVFADTQWRGAVAGDFILTRILRLAGLEEGVNRGGSVDTFERFIYLHGTNHEEQLGHPASHGCIRLSNRDVMDLFERIRDVPSWCWIGEGVSA